MASSKNTPHVAPTDGFNTIRKFGPYLRLIELLTAFCIGLPPLPLIAATWDFSAGQANPFAWPPPSLPLPTQVPGKFVARENFPRFTTAPSPSPTLSKPTAGDVWIPGDLDPIPLPDGMPVQGGPAGLALLEQAVGNGIVVGEVSDATTLNPIPGALVEIAGTGRTAEADAQGRFQFGGLPAGTFNIEASQLGYFTDTTVVTVIEGSPSEIRFGLRSRPTDDSANEFTLEEETIVGEYAESTQGDFNLDLAIDTSVTSIISKEEFTKTGVSDAAGAVGKVAGANIVGGKFAVVRGLADRYVTTLFNGAVISSADPSRKAVQLDIFPTTAIQSIEVNKTYWPTLPGDFGGGTIQINSLNIPQERIAEFKYKYGSNSNHDDRMLVIKDRDLGFWGDVDDPIPDGFLWNLGPDGEPLTFNAGGNRVTPGNTNNNTLRLTQIDEGLRQQALADAHAGNLRALDGLQSYMPVEVKPRDAESFSLVYGDRYDLDNGREFGFIAAFQHGENDETNAFGEENRLTEPSRSWNEESYTRELDWSVYLGAGYKLGENHEISANYFKKRIVSDNIRHGTNFEVDGDAVFGTIGNNDEILRRYGASAIYSKEFWTIDPVIRDTEIMQLRGTHRNGMGTSLSWGITDSTARESRPHSSNFQTGYLDFADPRIAEQAAINPSVIYNPDLGQRSVLLYSSIANDGNGTLDSSRETQFIEDSGLETSLDLVQSLYFSDMEEDGPRLELALGASRLRKEREQSGRIYLLRTQSWERWIQRNPPAWWTNAAAIAPFSPGSPLDGNRLLDGSPLPDGYLNLAEYLADNPDVIFDYYNGYANQNTGIVPGSGSGAAAARYVAPDAPFYLNGSGLEVRNVDSDLTLVALYAAATYYGEGWRLGGGGRWEEEIKNYEVAPSPLTRLLESDPSRVGNLSTQVFIPSLLAGYDLVPEKAIVNFAWSRTVARPTFFEFLPIESIAQDTGIVRRGNPDLTETSIENIDMGVDIQFPWNITGRVSAFHKTLEDPIVVVQRVDLGQNLNTYVNGNEGTISGIEIEGRWKGRGPFSITGNYAYIDSTLNYDVNQGLVVTPLETRFPFQPSQILNLTLGWEPEDSPWSAFLTANFTDEYPTILRSEPEDFDVWQLPQFTLDLVIARKFESDWMDVTLSLGIRNLTEESRNFEYRGGPAGGAGTSNGLVYTTEEPGRSVSLELKGTF